MSVMIVVTWNRVPVSLPSPMLQEPTPPRGNSLLSTYNFRELIKLETEQRKTLRTEASTYSVAVLIDGKEDWRISG